MAKTISVSVIIPNYNHSKYLPKRIESVLNQTFQDFEVILMDDCSPDNSQEILEEYRHHPKVSKLLFNDQNSGSTFKQWEKGIQEAVGQYIWIAESDDIADPLFLQTVMKVFQHSDRIGLVFTDSMKIDADGKELGRYSQIESFSNQVQWQQDYQLDADNNGPGEFIYKNVIPNASAVVFKKEVYQKTGGGDTSMMLERCRAGLHATEEVA